MKEQTRRDFQGKKHETPVFGELAPEFFRNAHLHENPAASVETREAPVMRPEWSRAEPPEKLASEHRSDFEYFSDLAGMAITAATAPEARFQQVKRLGRVILETALPSMAAADQPGLREDFAAWEPAKHSFPSYFPDLAETAFRIRHLSASPIAGLMPDEPPELPMSLFMADSPTCFAELMRQARTPELESER